MNDSDIVTVKNRSNSVVGYSIPELRIDRTFVKGESKKISMEELRQLSYQPGGQSLLNDYLVIVEKAAVDELVTNLQPEYNYDEAKIKEILTTGSLDELLDTLDFAPEGVIDIIKDISVAIKLNDVEKSLDRVGIKLRENETDWRNFYDVLNEIASKWQNFTDTQKSQITTALGGTRQRENVLTMLENWDKVQKYADIGANSSGTAMEKYGAVLDSVAAKQEQLTAKSQEFYNNLLNSSVIAGLLDLGKAFMDIMNLGDGLVGKIVLLVAALTALNAIANANILSGFKNMPPQYFPKSISELSSKTLPLKSISLSRKIALLNSLILSKSSMVLI